MTRRARTAYRRRRRDMDRMAWVRTQACCVQGEQPAPWCGPPPDACARHVEAHHAGAHGLGRKAGDDTVIPLCDHHHDALTDRRGAFAGWPPGALRTWQDAQAQRSRRVYDERRAGLMGVAF